VDSPEENTNSVNCSGSLIDIVPEDLATWRNKIFITFDIDWAHDDVLLDTYQLCLDAGVKSTFFVTHQTKLLEKLDADELVTLGIHPNFQPLLRKSPDGLSIQEEICRLMEIVPSAICTRSHGVIQGGILLQEIVKHGIMFEANDSIPFESGIQVKPFRTMYNLVKTPYVWTDEHEWAFDRRTNFARLMDDFDFLVGDFHPIHVFLNTENADRYERTREFHSNPKELIKHRYEGHGTRTLLKELLDLAKEPFRA